MNVLIVFHCFSIPFSFFVFLELVNIRDTRFEYFPFDTSLCISFSTCYWLFISECDKFPFFVWPDGVRCCCVQVQAIRATGTTAVVESRTAEVGT